MKLETALDLNPGDRYTFQIFKPERYLVIDDMFGNLDESELPETYLFTAVNLKDGAMVHVQESDLKYMRKKK